MKEMFQNVMFFIKFILFLKNTDLEKTDDQRLKNLY